MKKSILLAICLIINISNAQEKKSLLWKISGNGLTEASYLFGTIHISCDATLSPKVLKALDNTKQLCLEIDMDDPEMQQKIMSTVMMKDAKTVESLTSKENFTLLDEFITKQTGYSIKMLNTIKPFAIAAMLYPKMINCPIQSFEGELMKVAKTQNEETIGLETIELQMDIFDAIPYQTQVDELVKSAKNDLKSDIKELSDMLDIYKKEDIDKMYKMSIESENQMMSKFNDVLLVNRNKAWISKIEEISKQKPTFYGVGAAHLGGSNGVINLLRKQGFKVEAVLK